MCGIAGFTIAPGDLGQIDTRAMTAVLAYEMKIRGTDATGIATVDARGRFKVRKKPYPADVFIASRQGIGCNAQSLLLHTRAATQGKASNPLNNHPITHGDIVGIHNGIVFNDDKLFAHFPKWRRNGQVDSEAIFAALHHLPQDEALTNIDGSWAIAWMNTADDPRKLWLARGSSSPLYFATTKAGSIVFASTSSAVESAFEFGGISGKAEVSMAPEGFLAHTEPDAGGLTILDPFDPSGKKAIGVRAYKAEGYTGYTGGYAHGGGGYGGSEDDDWWARPGGSTGFIRKALPIGTTSCTPYVRMTIIGDPDHPRIGDRRKYLGKDRAVVFEACTSVKPEIWSKLHEPAAPLEQRIAGAMEPTSCMMPERATEPTTSVPSTTLAQWKSRSTETPIDPADEAVVLPFDDEPKSLLVLDDDLEAGWAEEDPDVRYGFAGVGDLIGIPKRNLGDRSGGQIIGMVIDTQDNELLVEWKTGRIARFAEYEVLIKAQKGG